MAKTTLPAELTDLLARLRSQIQRYVLLEGSASVLVVLGLLFWLSLGLDWSYFWLQRAELPRWIRFVIEVAAVCTCLVLFAGWVAIRWLRHFRQRALALVLERRFPELNDRLITAIELTGDQAQPLPPLTQAMLQRTINEVREASTHLDLTTVFDKRPLVRAGISASCLVVSVLAFAICFSDVFGLWFRRNVLLADAPWKRETGIQLVVLAEPGERVVEFKDRVYKHPRGSDLTLQATVSPGMKVPEQVQLRYNMTDGSARGRAYFSKLGETQFKHTLTGILGSLDCYLLAGDAERTPYHIQVVEPPRVDRIVLDALFPAYTGMNEPGENGQPARTPKPVQGTQLSLPAGTDFLLRADTNKPLVGVRIQTASYDLEVFPASATLTLFKQDGQTKGGSFVIPASKNWLPADGKSFSVPFLLASPLQQAMFSGTGELLLPLRLPPDAQLKIFLSDADGIQSAEPTRLTLNSIVDEPPAIETQLRGIGSAITRKAIIPVTGSISDDYGVADARFDFRLDSADAQPRSFPVQPKGIKKFPLQQAVTQPWLRFDVLPLELKIGQKLSLSVVAQDADNLSGPHFSQGEKYNFTIVSDEELLSQLYARELNLRQRFEQILIEVQRTQTDLTVARKTVVELLELRGKPGKPPAKAGEKDQKRGQQLELLDQNSATAAERGLYGIRKNHNETQAIGQSLGDIREEMINNGVDTPKSLERMDAKLLRPLKGINDIDFPDVDQRLGLFRLALQEQTDPLNRLDESLVALDRLKRKLELVLTEMRKLETYKELLEILKAIKSQQEDLKKRTETENKRSIINKLK